MKKLAVGLLLVLVLAGCSNATDAMPSAPPTRSATPTPSVTAEAGVGSAAEITDLRSGAEYALSLKPGTPDLSSEMSATANRLGDLIAEDDLLPFNVHNDIGSDLIRVNADVLNNPDAAESYLPDLYAIAGVIQGAI
jgi:hypothetical protein